MRTIDELEPEQLDSAGYPDCEFAELDEGIDEVSEELELLARCVHAARFAGA
jgi:hypothetical protein